MAVEVRAERWEAVGVGAGEGRREEGKELTARVWGDAGGGVGCDGGGGEGVRALGESPTAR